MGDPLLPLPVVHNYGHCGYGVMSSPGTSLTAVNMVRECLEGDLEDRVNTARAKL